MELTVKKLAKHLGAELVGRDNGSLRAVRPIEAAGAEDVTFILNDKHRSKISNCRAGAVIVSRRIEKLQRPQMVVKNVEAALIEVLRLFAPELKRPAAGIDKTARIAEDVRIGEAVSIGAYVTVDSGVKIGDGTVIGDGCRIGQDSKIGSDCRIDANVVIYHNCRIGCNCIIQANTTIGSTGFGYSSVDGRPRLIPHIGGVVVEDFVEIGANCCVDRAKFDNTVIGAGTKIDNLVQIAHNVVIGKCCLIAGQTGISGSCRIGDGVVLAGQVGIADNVKVCDGAMIGAQAGVIGEVEAGKKMWGTPATDKTEQLRLINLVKRLPKFWEQLRQLVKRIERLEASEDDRE
jgi:UDP-3-O-[3-hydroxymyristoyl] glucosamine N-acyltransferase